MLRWHIAGILLIPITLTACGGTGVVVPPDNNTTTIVQSQSSIQDAIVQPQSSMIGTSYNSNDTTNNSSPQKTVAQYQQEWYAEQERQKQLQLRAKLAAQQQQQQILKQQQAQQMAAQQQPLNPQQAQAQQRMAQQQRAQTEQDNRAEAQRQATLRQQFLAQKRLMEQQQQLQFEQRLAQQQQNARGVAAQARQQPQSPLAPAARVNVAAAHTSPAAAGIRAYRAASKQYKGPGQLRALPDAVAASLRTRGVSESGMSSYVRNANGGVALLTAQADTSRSPASTMKLVTTYVALGTLGPNYRWPTEIYIAGNVRNGVLAGDIYLKGYGDPDFREEHFLRMLQALRARGIQSVAGNLVVDRSYFQIPYQDPGAFDGKPDAAYNAQPEALLYEERGSCYEFKNLKGQVQKICPVLPRSKVAQDALNTNIFGGFWKLWVGQLRGQLSGSFAEGRVPQNAQLIYRHQSQPLSEIIKTVNKDSNNVMARQILLSIGAKQLGVPGTPRKGAEAIGRWLESRGLNFPELRIENGSGLSRISRISARNLGEMLVDAYNSPYRVPFMNSLAVLGVEGTVRNRLKQSPARGRGHLKTGTLRDVRAIAGYLQASDGQTYVISILHNDPKARSSAREAHDELIEWVYAGRHQVSQR